ncbi:nucleotidyl transferase AbiEii/AbiGii toxin family protein (plasmid) [Agrobacterium vitis]|nr:nucleotidyl transferase AbiEii/AbiGii toxin family protein [Agrobacterium vitis]MCF1474900.1 nucleotidyl transferase AbiEii/AbiGii toxin family protein [Allorhizobium ampelinum]MVA73535.1 nucleotidyl transferase AbiEii/AbiGii toxin family protein [Agrobacterium vitis]NSZ19850.1 nucleotidyl transferase AbiEii/AbiGii toxin family protein [Agrobacterium vitis]QZO07243.1 nucleotidyl transferase AbiEii/AbiGii toxin family protein [Agrobacterium vitis]UJL91149.1 nucleotidyl transferase AbiEii/Abi
MAARSSALNGNPDRKTLLEVQEFFGLPSPALVEKDWFVVRALAAIHDVQVDGLTLAFGGGTALGRAYRLLERMSEDIDLRIVGKDNPSRGELKRLRATVNERLEAAGFAVEGHYVVKQSDRYVRYDLPYEPIAKGEGVLRPEIKIEIAAFPICTAPENRSVASFVAEATGASAEATDVACVRLVETAADKFVGLGRRAGFAFADLGPLDHTLVRHVYDLSRMDGHYDADEAAAIALETMKAEAKSRADDYPAYKADPRAETLRAYETMSKHGEFAAGYAKLLGDMVYGEKPGFEAAFEKVQHFVERIRKA